MKTLYPAIFNYFQTEIPSVSLFNTEAIEGTAFPYVVFTILPGAPADTLGEKLESGIIQFNVYSNSPTIEEAMNIQQYIWDAFDDSDFAITDYTLDSIMRLPGIVTKEINNGVKIWNLTIQYEYIIGKN